MTVIGLYRMLRRSVRGEDRQWDTISRILDRGCLTLSTNGGAPMHEKAAEAFRHMPETPKGMRKYVKEGAFKGITLKGLERERDRMPNFLKVRSGY